MRFRRQRLGEGEPAARLGGGAALCASKNPPPAGDDDPRAAHGFKPLGREYPETSVGWYRRVFDLPASDLGRRLSLEFDGVFRDAW